MNCTKPFLRGSHKLHDCSDFSRYKHMRKFWVKPMCEHDCLEFVLLYLISWADYSLIKKRIVFFMFLRFSRPAATNLGPQIQMVWVQMAWLIYWLKWLAPTWKVIYPTYNQNMLTSLLNMLDLPFMNQI